MRYLLGVSTLEYDASKCTGCGRCTEVCPHGVFEMREKRAYLTDADLCMECGACKANCAFGAIEVKAGVGCAYAIINSMIYGGEPSCCGDPAPSGDSSSCC